MQLPILSQAQWLSHALSFCLTAARTARLDDNDDEADDDYMYIAGGW